MTKETNVEDAVIKVKQALCVRSVNEVRDVITGASEHLDTFMVPRSICETFSETQPLEQLIPYVNMTALDIDKGILFYVSYTRPVGGSEERLHGDRSVGFGGHIDDVADIAGEAVGETEAYPEASYPTFRMTRAQLVETLYRSGRRELLEELGVDLKEDLGVTLENVQLSIQGDETPDEVGKVHLCCPLTVDLHVNDMETLINKATAEAREIANLQAIGIAMEEQIRGGEEAFNGLGDHLKQEISMERWSILVVLTRVRGLVNFIATNTTFSSWFREAERNFTMKLEQARAAEIAQEEQVQEQQVGEAQQQAQVEDDGLTAVTDLK